MTARGLDHLPSLVGKKLTAVKRFVLAVDAFPGPFEHGITEMSFESDVITVAAGPNQDYLVIEPRPINPLPLRKKHWTPVELGHSELSSIGGALRSIEVFSDGVEDVALQFQLDAGDSISIVLVDGNVVMGNALERFDGDPNHVVPVHRLRVSR